MDNDQEVASEVGRISGLQQRPQALLEHLETKSTGELNRLLPALFSTGYAGEEKHALRDTVIAVLYRKVGGSLAESIDRSADAASRLTKVGWWLTVVIGAVGILVSVVLAFK